jgi:Flp pilus assembly protein TadG
MELRNHGKRLTRRITARAAAARLAGHVLRFRREDEGAMVIFSLFIFVVMLAMGGIGIDVMRQEMERARLQATLDRAVLAGAGAPEGTDEDGIKTIVEDYFDKSGMRNYLNEIDTDGEGKDDIVTSLNATKVSASGQMTLDTLLMKLSGVKTLTAAGAATAEVRTPKLEIVLVLDVSGSMGRNNKLRNLKTAAKDFVSTVLGQSDPGNTVISIVPFSWSVTPSQGLYEALAVDEKHTYSTCLRFKDKDFNHASLTSGASATSNGIPVDQMIYTSLYGGWQNLSRTWRSCFTDDYMRILPYSIDEAALHGKIDSLQASGNTSGQQGMKWGAALLDPTFRTKGVTSNLIDTGEMEASLTTVPADYTEPETLKVVVMMGDGQNTTSYFFDTSPPEYRGKHSDLFKVQHQEQEFDYAFDIYNPSREWHQSWVEQYCYIGWLECVYKVDGPIVSSYYLRDPSPERYRDLEDNEWLSKQEFEAIEDQEGFVSKEQLDWEEAWGLMSPDFYRDTTGSSGPWTDYRNSEYLNGSMKDVRMRNVCTATKDEGVVVYTIGFEVNKGGTAETELRGCATTPAHYYRAEGVNINDAFNSIASNVKNLRLTQ